MLNRRDFLKLAALFSAGAGLQTVSPLADGLHQSANKAPNIILLLFDAMSARNLSLYGYGRRTTPNLELFADHSIVYHSHVSSGNFTTPGTASLLTGLYPWTHRAINHRGQVDRRLADVNLFNLLGDSYYRAGFAQNVWANVLLSQFNNGIDLHLSPNAFMEKHQSLMPSEFVKNDPVLGFYAFDDFLTLGTQSRNPIPGSLSMSFSDMIYSFATGKSDTTARYPKGFPTNFYSFFDLSTLASRASETLMELAKQPEPFLAYLHFFPPHEPYRPTSDFIDLYSVDDLEIPFKPRHKLAGSHHNKKQLQSSRKEYDEFITNLDFEFGEFFEKLSDSGLLDSSYVIVTSDHGEMFERGEQGHGSRLLFEPVIHVPLVISVPGQQKRVDIHSPTSSIDVLPTLLNIAERQVPGQLEGRLLPGLGGTADMDRGIFSMVASTNSAFLPFTKCTVSITRGAHKLIHYIGYPGYDDMDELYDLQEDPEEKKNRFDSQQAIARSLKDELLDTLATVNKRFEAKQ